MCRRHEMDCRKHFDRRRHHYNNVKSDRFDMWRQLESHELSAPPVQRPTLAFSFLLFPSHNYKETTMRNLTFASLCVAAAALSTAITPTQAEAQFGVEVVFAEHFDLGLGGRFMMDIDAFSDDDGSVLQELRFIADGIFYPSWCDGCSAFELNANGAVPLNIGEGDADIYAGAGLNFTRTSFDTGIDLPGFDASASNVGLNIFGGLNFPLGSFAAFAEAGITVGGFDHFGIKGGILVGGN